MNKNLSLIILLIFSACDENGKIVVPPDDPPDTSVVPCINPHSTNNFNWTIDSIGEKESFLNSIAGGIYAFSDSDAYAMGMFYKDGLAHPGAHWNGKDWTYLNISTSLRMATHAVAGDKNRMVAVGGKFTVLGGQQVLELTKSDRKWKKTEFAGYKGNLNTVWTDGIGYYIAGGDDGLLVEKESEKAEWKIIQTPADFFYIHKVTGIDRGKIYLQVYARSIGDQIWSRVDGKWTLLYDQSRTDTTFSISMPPKSEISDISILHCRETNSIQLFVGMVPVKLFTVQNNGTVFTLTENPFSSISQSELLNIFPIAQNDIWLTGNYLYHYDGTSLVKVSFTDNFSNFSAGLPFVTPSGKVFALLIAWDYAMAIAQSKPTK